MVDKARVDGENGAEALEESAPAIDPAQLAAFEAMVAAMHDDMARVAFVISEGPGPAQDAVRSAWVRAWQALTSSTPPAHEHRREWLLGLAAIEARHVAETGYRARDDAPGGAGVAATQASAARAFTSEELELANALAALDGPDRMIVALRYVGGLEAESIARELNISDRTVLAKVARTLKSLVGEARLAEMPSQNVAEYEAALGHRMRSLTSRAVVPLDPAEVAQAAIDAAEEAPLSERVESLLRRTIELSRRVDRRIALAVASALLFVVFVPGLLRGISLGGGPAATSVPNDAKRLCAQDELVAGVESWQVNGADRIASVLLRNIASSACLIASAPTPSLVDGNGNSLIASQGSVSNTTRIGPDDVLRTKVEVHDYCGPAPALPVSISFHDGTVTYLARLGGDATRSLATCVSGSSGSIRMQPWGS